MSYPKAIDEALAELEKHRERIMGFLDAARVAEKAITAFPAMNLSASIGYSAHTMQGVLIFCDVTDMRDVIPLLRWLAQEGYPKKGEPSDYPEIKRGCWNCGVIQVGAFLPYTDGAKCS